MKKKTWQHFPFAYP